MQALVSELSATVKKETFAVNFDLLCLEKVPRGQPWPCPLLPGGVGCHADDVMSIRTCQEVR